jgi:hypothetical protein
MPKTAETGAAGWSLNGQMLGPDQLVNIPEAIETIALVVRLPEGFENADGFDQRVTVSTANHAEEYELAPAGAVTLIAVPLAAEINLTLSIGFCSIKAKETCYIDRAELTFTRIKAQSQEARIELTYVPEEPS